MFRWEKSVHAFPEGNGNTNRAILRPNLYNHQYAAVMDLINPATTTLPGSGRLQILEVVKAYH